MATLSVITICFNNLADLQATCASVDRQERHPDEHYIINGSTTPDIQEWLERTPQAVYRKWISEPDKGIADAFNKGISLAGGEVTHLLNSGDLYASADVTAAVMQVFESDPAVQWTSGNLSMMRGGQSVTVGKPFAKDKLYRGMRSVLHPTWFVRKEVYGRIGGFKDYRIAMDYDLMCRIADEPYHYIDKTITVFDDTGISSTAYLRALKETRTVYESYHGWSMPMALWQLRLKTLHHLLNTGLGKWLFRIKKKLGGENW